MEGKDKELSPRVHKKRLRSKKSRILEKDGKKKIPTKDEIDNKVVGQHHPSVLINGYEQDDEDLESAERCSARSTSPRIFADSVSLGGCDLFDKSPRRPSTNSTSRLEVANHKYYLHRGLTAFVDREMTFSKKSPSLSDPQASPAQRSMRSRSSLDKSPRRKRSKSESRRRRERKLIAAGEIEVRQANETLMKYLKQCSEINDASLSGELEIDKSIEERKVHRKTKSERDKKGNIMRKLCTNGAISSILKDLADDIIPADGDDIYNPFTPVVSPTDDKSSRINKMFIQTSNGYKSVDSGFYKNSLSGDVENNRQNWSNVINISTFQRIWITFSNICHGLLGGLALSHILLIVRSNPHTWSTDFIDYYTSFAATYTYAVYFLGVISIISVLYRIKRLQFGSINATGTVSFKWIIIAMIYIATIILTASTEFLDEKPIFTSKEMSKNITFYEPENILIKEHFGAWNSISIARSICAFLGWILISTSLNDMYLEYTNMERYPLTN